MTKKQEYAEYRKSDHWMELRERAMKRDGYRCVKCKSFDHLAVHHTIYRTPWESALLEDLQTLCKACHDLEHPGHGRNGQARCWSKLFASMFDGSMLGIGGEYIAVWMYALAHMKLVRSVGMIVELEPVRIAEVIGMESDAVKDILVRMSQPDPHSRGRRLEGKRLVWVEAPWLFLVVNGMAYHRLNTREDLWDFHRQSGKIKNAGLGGVG